MNRNTRTCGVHPLLATWLMGLALAAPADAQNEPATPPQQTATQMDPYVEAVARIRPSVVGIGSYNFRDRPTVQYAGTGFVVEDGLMVVTNQHVVEAIRARDRLDQMRVFFPNATAVDGRPATLIAEDRHHDVALLRIGGPPARAVTLKDEPPAQGQSVGIMGYPIGLQLGLVPATHRGVIAAIVPAVLPLPTGVQLTPELAEAIRRPYNLYQLDMVVYPGNSGSPLFDAADGEVIGIINKTLATRTREHLLTNPSGISYAVPVRWVRELILRVNAERPEPTREPQP